MIMIDILTCIKAFRAVVEEKSFTAAAKRLNLSKVLVSRYIANLEKHLNSQLLNRTTRSISLTSVGQTYYSRCVPLADEILNINNSIYEDKENLTGTLNVLAPSSLTEMYLMPSICSFRDKHPDISINLCLNNKVMDLFTEGFDVAIRSGNFVNRDLNLISVKLMDNDVITCASAKYLKTNKIIKIPADLLDQSLIVDNNLHNQDFWEFKKDNKVESIKVNSKLSIDSIQAIKKALLLDQGIAMMPKFAVEEELKQGSLIHILNDYSIEKRSVYALYPSKRYVPSKVKLFIKELKLNSQQSTKTDLLP
ncbi:LysR family transcriptional regulator [Francisella sp. Scap27]|nr:LysR family transcriptional regulator [Francisella sp. Scap27]